MAIEEPASLDEQALRAEIHRQVRIRHRGLLVITTVIALLVGGVIGFFSSEEHNGARSGKLTPPAAWNSVACLPDEDPDVTPIPTVTPQPLRVYVSGAVVAPQVVTLTPGSLVADAMAAVGGPTEDAFLNDLNMAAPLADHQHIIIPRSTPVARDTAEPNSETPGLPPDTSAVLIDINTADIEELATLPRIGETRAQQIIDYREANGLFQRKEDIQLVSGIGPSTYAEIAPYITVVP